VKRFLQILFVNFLPISLSSPIHQLHPNFPKFSTPLCAIISIIQPEKFPIFAHQTLFPQLKNLNINSTTKKALNEKKYEKTKATDKKRRVSASFNVYLSFLFSRCNIRRKVYCSHLLNEK
jgi:hypothetical protein